MKEEYVKYIYYFVVALGAIVLIFGIISTSSILQNPSLTDENQQNANLNKSFNMEEFAKCLTEKGAVLYGAYWCPHCRNQKELFGESIKYIKYVECQAPNGGQTEECTKAGIDAYPTWIINGKKYLGEKKLSELASLTGCYIK
ncbi:MAG: hypothetical protein QW153_01170 [Candidatus Bilamarchaeaceae archaeon]